MSNPYRLIKQFALFTGLWLAAATATQAQQSYYICIQSENGQPFYTQIGDKVYSSSAIGHLIISGLKDNDCNLEIGFPQHISRPQQFTVPVRGKDQGYQLKKSGSQDWTLVSWQGQETIKPKKGAGSSDLLYGERKKDDAFATLMAAVVNDSAVLYTSIVKNDAPAAPAVAKAEEKVVQAAPDSTSATVAAITTDTAKVYRNDKPLFDTTAAVAKVYTNDKPLFDTTSRNDKPLMDTATAVAKEYRNDKPLYDTATAVAKEYLNDKPLFDTTAAVAKTKNDNNSIIDLTTGKPLYDTSVVAEVAEEPVVKEKTAEKAPVMAVKKQDKPDVIKVQQTKKDGETKIVFIDSSESPAAVVTVYIPEEPVQQKAPAQPVSTDLTNTTPKTDTEPKPDAAKKPDTAAKEAETKKEVAKAPISALPANKDAGLQVEVVSTAVPATVEKPKAAPDKPAGKKGDTVVVILGSTQQKADSASRPVRQEAPKPLYAPRETPLTEADKPASNAAVASETDKTDKKGRGSRAKNADKTDNTQPVGITDKKAFAEPPAKKEPVAADVSKTESPASSGQEPAKAVYDPNPTELDKKVVMINSDCNRFATDSDVDKLRVKMLAEKDAGKRVGVANKVFKTMCLTAKQIKALSELFPTDETKYKFMEMAYPFAADTANFKQLFDLFSAETYQTKFKTLVRY